MNIATPPVREPASLDALSPDDELPLPLRIGAPVGVRWGSVQQANRVADQRLLIRAFAAVPPERGGTKGVPQTEGGRRVKLEDGRCEPALAEAIRAFQRHHQLGTDSVADPQGTLLARLNELLSQPQHPRRPSSASVPPRGQRFKRPSSPAIPGQCSITNITNATTTLGVAAGGYFAFEVQDTFG